MRSWRLLNRVLLGLGLFVALAIPISYVVDRLVGDSPLDIALFAVVVALLFVAVGYWVYRDSRSSPGA